MPNSTFAQKQNGTDNITHQSTNILDSLALALVIAKASTLARLGLLKKAEAILQPITITNKANEDVYALLGKIKAQQGKYFESKQMWQRVLTKNPFHPQAKRAIHRLNNNIAQAKNSSIIHYIIWFGIIFNSGMIYMNWQMNNLSFELVWNNFAALSGIMPAEELSDKETKPVQAAAETNESEEQSTSYFKMLSLDDIDLASIAEKFNFTSSKDNAIDPNTKSSNEITNYTVKRGDTLWDIAEMYYQDPHKWTILAKHNNISTSNPLWVGLEIEIPNPKVIPEETQ